MLATASASDKKTPVTLQLLWTHQGNCGGYYVADKQGLYAAEGLDIRFIEGGPEADLISPVLTGRAQFGVANAGELLVAREQGKPVRAIATIFRRSPTVYVSKASSGIRRPEDFRGKTIRVTTVDSAGFFAMMARSGIAPTEYRQINLPSEVALFSSGAADVWSVYVNNFAVTLEQAGQKLNYIYPDDYGVHLYADSLFATDDTITTAPELVLGFLRASLRGWTIAVEDPALVGTLAHAYNPKLDIDTEIVKMRATQPLVNTGEDHIGWMQEARWTQMAKTLEEHGALSGTVNVNDAFTLAFLRKIYGSDPAIQ